MDWRHNVARLIVAQPINRRHRWSTSLTSQRRLLLIKHSLPAPIRGIDAHQWSLSDEGRRRCELLAERIRPYTPTAIFTSQEPKAQETAEIVGRVLSVSVEPFAGLHEHDRTGVPWLGQDQFDAAIRSLFDHAEELVFGRETAEQARARFSDAIDSILDGHPTGNIAIVAHGTVISLYLAAKTGIDPFPMWQR